MLVIQAALTGEGIALGWQHLIDAQVKAKTLVPVGGHVLETGLAFYVVWPRSRELTPQARRVRDWLIEDGDRNRIETPAGSPERARRPNPRPAPPSAV